MLNLRTWGLRIQVFSRRPIWAFWRPKSPNWTSWEKKPQARFPAGLVWGGDVFRIVLDPFVYPCFNRYDLRPRNNFVFQRPRLISIWKYEIRPNDLRIIIIYPDTYSYTYHIIIIYKYEKHTFTPYIYIHIHTYTTSSTTTTTTHHHPHHRGGGVLGRYYADP